MGGEGIGGIVPLLCGHLSQAVVGQGHVVAVGVVHALESAVAVLIGIRYQTFLLAGNADAFQVVEGVVAQVVLHTVAPGDGAQVVEGIVAVGDLGVFRGDSGGPAVDIIGIGGGIAAAVVVIWRKGAAYAAPSGECWSRL